MNPADQSNEAALPEVQMPAGTRRTFFNWVIGAAAAVIGIGLAVPLIGYVISPALKRREQPWVPVGEADELKVLEPKPLEYVTTVRDGWMETRVQRAVWAIKQPDGSITVFSPICTHLGCGYRWDESDRKFKCPCHLSEFSITGEVLGGPAPRPLDRLPAKVENGQLLVIYKEFRPGLQKSVEI